MVLHTCVYFTHLLYATNSHTKVDPIKNLNSIHELWNYYVFVDTLMAIYDDNKVNRYDDDDEDVTKGGGRGD